MDTVRRLGVKQAIERGLCVWDTINLQTKSQGFYHIDEVAQSNVNGGQISRGK